MGKVRAIFILAVLCCLIFLATSGQFLVVNHPRKSDVLVVLAGETEQRPARGLELLRDGYAPRLVLDVPADTDIYGWSQLELAQRYIQSLPQADSITICPVHALSTRSEAKEVDACLASVHPKTVLLVTSDYHTRRALSIFERVVPAYDYRVAAAFDAREFGTRWWQHREWAKMNLAEWTKLIWWELIERWR